MRSANLGFPRIGARRELKTATEAYWNGRLDPTSLLEVGRQLRAAHWRLQRDVGIDIIPSNDFSFYDHVLDMTAMLDAVPPRFSGTESAPHLDIIFAMARGTDDVPAMEMTKWFDTNYHYIVPEFEDGQRFRIASAKAVDEFLEARALGIHTRPVLIGPVTYLLLGKARDSKFGPLSLLDGLLDAYGDLLGRLKRNGADWVQVDEPALVLDLPPSRQTAFRKAYAVLAGAGSDIMLTSYFGGLGDNLELAARLPVAGLHVDLVRVPGQLDGILEVLGPDRVLSLGVVDGRNIWRADLDTAARLVDKAVSALGHDRVQVAPSCSLLHVPVDLESENRLDDEIKSWMAFAKQKLMEIHALARAAVSGRTTFATAFEASAKAKASRASTPERPQSRGPSAAPPRDRSGPHPPQPLSGAA